MKLICLAAALFVTPPVEERAAAEILSELVAETLEVSTPTRSATEYQEAARAYRSLIERMGGIDAEALSLDDRVDHDLLAAKLRTRLWEIEELKLHTLRPAGYFAFSQTDRLLLRPGALRDGAVRKAVKELHAAGEVYRNARHNLERPARTWTENALYQASYVRLLLEKGVPEIPVDDPALREELLEAARSALSATSEFESWLETELLPRSTRSPAWTPDQIEVYQFQHEQLDEYGVERMIEIAEREEAQLTEEMTRLARRIHPGGDLRRVWELMKDEAPPWPEVLPMAQRYVDMMAAWLGGPGSHIVTIPDFDYGATLTTPMGRRTLSFGGAEYGPTVAGRLSGYYVLTPLEDRLPETERASRIRSYNPYWTNVISYHEWLGHTVQRAAAEIHARGELRKRYGSSYLSQAWSFYLEGLMEDEGYFETLPYMEELKTRMARRQMRMWRVQRILTKCRMAKGEMTFDEAVEAYIDKIGMEPTNAFIEVQRDSQTPSPPGREIIGDRIIRELRDEYERRMGRHYSMKLFHDTLLSYGPITFKQIRRLMFRE